MTPVWCGEGAGQEDARSRDTQTFLQVCFHYLVFTPSPAIYLLSDCSDLQGDSHDKKLWGCEPRLFDFDRKILSQEELWRERRSERSENVNIFPDNFEICEKEWSSGLDQEIHHPSLLGGALPVKCLRLMEKFYILKSILFSILCVFFILNELYWGWGLRFIIYQIVRIILVLVKLFKFHHYFDL